MSVEAFGSHVDVADGWATIAPVNDEILTTLKFTPADPNLGFGLLGLVGVAGRRIK